MRKVGWTPSIVPGGDDDKNIYLVLGNLGRLRPDLERSGR
jgi:hypothetical protein